MNREIIDLPCGLFGPLVSDWILNVRGRAGNDSVTGNGQVVYGNAARWEATLDLSGFGRERQLAWAAIRAKLRGRVNLLRVCVCDRWRPKYSELGLSDEDIALIRGDGIPHSDDTLFSDGTGYGYAPTIVLEADIGAGSESITVDATSVNDALQPGHWFSIDDWLYQVSGMDGDMDDRTYYFEPALRRAATAGMEISLEASTIMAFQTDMEGRMARELGKHGNTQIQLVEWTNRPIS